LVLYSFVNDSENITAYWGICWAPQMQLLQKLMDALVSHFSGCWYVYTAGAIHAPSIQPIQRYVVGTVRPFQSYMWHSQYRSYLLQIYCNSRMPHKDIELGADKSLWMVECNEWYHHKCKPVPPEAFDPTTDLIVNFICRDCKNRGHLWPGIFQTHLYFYSFLSLHTFLPSPAILILINCHYLDQNPLFFCITSVYFNWWAEYTIT